MIIMKIDFDRDYGLVYFQWNLKIFGSSMLQ